MKLLYIAIFTAMMFWSFLQGIAFQEKRHPYNPQPKIDVHAITMPESCYQMLKNANMIHIKILEANEK